MVTPTLPTIFDVLRIIIPDYKYVTQPQEKLLLEVQTHRHAERVNAWISKATDTLTTVKFIADHDFGMSRDQLASKEVQQELIAALNSDKCSKGMYLLRWVHQTCLSVSYPSKDNVYMSLEQCVLFLECLDQIQDSFILTPRWTLEKMKAATKSSFFEKHQYLREIRDRYRFLMFRHFGEGV